VDTTILNRDAVAFGARVRVLDLDASLEEEYVLVSPGEEDYENNKILTNSPIGLGLLGKKKGEIAEITVPMGVLRYEILEISAP
jgi:transcription elongation factor GreA